MPRNKYPEETVQKILDVSMKLFLEKGYEETTILDIVGELGGLTRGAFYLSLIHIYPCVHTPSNHQAPPSPSSQDPPDFLYNLSLIHI